MSLVLFFRYVYTNCHNHHNYRSSHLRRVLVINYKNASQAFYLLKEYMKDILFNLINIHSPSGNEGGVAKYISAFLNELSIESKIDAFGNFYAYIPGQGEPILCTAHMDVISNGFIPVVSEENGVVRSKNDAVLGLDDKASIAIILDMVRNFEDGHRPIEILFTAQEEPGCLGALYVFKQKSFDIKSSVGISFDLPQPVGSILKSAAGIWRGKYIFKGVSAHSARPEEGINALAAASQWVLEFLKRKSEERRVNVSYLSVGQSELFNMIPALAEIEVEVRSFDDIDEEKKYIDESLSQLEVEVELVSEFVRLQQYGHDVGDVWIKDIEQSMRDCSIDPTSVPKTFGGADANVFQEQGINVALLGNGVSQTHSVNECVELRDLYKMSEFLQHLVS